MFVDDSCNVKMDIQWAYIAYKLPKEESYKNHDFVSVRDIYVDEDTEQAISPKEKDDFSKRKKYYVRFCECGENECNRTCDSAYKRDCLIHNLTGNIHTYRILPSMNS